ncbi:hypothetical protein BO70DRAFT_379659 [Aspergillus heteromorphus CBS 117.55]|uniref:Tautomerase cis-CaaD-like domain-containing protein n=1 Tax=Aspergillus heteromorphus CBS 117.55 TaxID=1448321 RepID=A0A317W8B0_9EURO|nr:uncharacterized protein BO70DRAFT_379659 [Aspergillus heteromorphus CBS 117.55]PWY82145.1 hypothetical protein BO70DRAFT_379659 [Aspergillus heteromorphus CBS 117.55]
MYTTLGLPAFYVVVHFTEMPLENVFIGGATRSATEKPFVRVVITHIAIRAPDTDAAYRGATARLDRILNPHLLNKGYDFEYHVDETERRLWKINGLVPPRSGSEEEKVWGRENRAGVYEGGD